MFDYIDQLNYLCHEISFDRGELNIDFSDYIKSKRKTMKPTIKYDDKCFQYASTVALN